MKTLLIFSFISQIILSQSLQVFDQNTKSGIPYAIVMVDTTGYYTDADGRLTIKLNKFDSISIEHLNYHKLKINKIKDSLFLKPKAYNLDEIEILNYDALRPKRLKTPRGFLSTVIVKQTEALTCLCLKKEKYLNSKITELRFEVSGSKYHIKKEKLDKQKAVLRLNLYKNEKNFPGQSIYSYAPVTFSLKKVFDNKSYFVFDLKHKPIELTKEGFCFGLEHLEFINDKNNAYRIKELFMESYLDKSKYFKAKTYLNYPLHPKYDSLISNKRFLKESFKNLNIKKDAPIFIPEMIIYQE